MRHTSLLPIAAVLLGFALPASAQQAQTGQGGGSMPGMQMQGSQGMSGMQNMTPFQKDTMAAMDKMNKAMMDGMMDSDPGMAWMKSMAAHHQGAIDMSEIVLKHTKDADVTREARKTAQQNEKDLKELHAKIRKEDKKS
ncbi:protein of unknown function [Methylobacterium sp. yr596]|nr:protein of unknown function [Methylobacterium sp. yr596]